MQQNAMQLGGIVVHVHGEGQRVGNGKQDRVEARAQERSGRVFYTFPQKGGFCYATRLADLSDTLQGKVRVGFRV